MDVAQRIYNIWDFHSYLFTTKIKSSLYHAMMFQHNEKLHTKESTVKSAYISIPRDLKIISFCIYL